MAYEINTLKKKEDEDVLQGTEGEKAKVLTQTEQIMTPGGVPEATQTGMGQVAPVGGQDVSDQQKYQDINRQKALELGQKAAGVITGDIEAAQQAIESAGEQYKNYLSGGTVGLDQDFYTRAANLLTQQKEYEEPSYSPPGPGMVSAPEVLPTLETQPEPVVEEEIPNYTIRAYNEPSTPTISIGGGGLLETPTNIISLGAPTVAPAMTPTPAPEYDPTQQLSAADQYKLETFGTTTPGAEAPLEEVAPVEPVPEVPVAAQVPEQFSTLMGIEEFLANQENIEKFRNLYGAEFRPEDLYSQEYAGEAEAAAEKAKRTAELIEDLSGRQRLISRTYDRPSGRFSAGTLALDEALLAANPEAYAELIKAATPARGVPGQLERMYEEGIDRAAEAQAATEQTREQMREEFNLSREEKEIRDRAERLKSQALEDYAAYRKYIQDTYGVQEGLAATDYFNAPDVATQIRAANVASAEDYARLKALEELTQGIGTLSGFESEAGGYKQYINPADRFNLAGFQENVKSTREARIAAEEAEAERLAAIEEAKRAEEEKRKAQEAAAIGAVIGGTVGGVAGGFIGGPVGVAVGVAVGSTVGAAVGTAVCFDPNTPIKMADGSLKAIKDIEIGDIVFEGGIVHTISKHRNKQPMCDYKGTIVTSTHAVYENGSWIRVGQSLLTKKSDVVCDVVVSLSCENHVLVINDTLFSDYEEVDNDQGLTDAQCLKIKNGGNY